MRIAFATLGIVFVAASYGFAGYQYGLKAATQQAPKAICVQTDDGESYSLLPIGNRGQFTLATRLSDDEQRLFPLPPDAYSGMMTQVDCP